jgi:hypothetical protein
VSRRQTPPTPLPLLAIAIALAVALALTACGSSGGGARSTGSGGATFTSAGSSTTPAANAGRSCAALVANATAEVAGRIYHEASSGADVAEAVQRVQSSSALRAAIAAGDASAAERALSALLVNQIVGVEIVKGASVFASAGAGRAIAPVHGPIPGSDARFVLSTQAAHSYTQVVQQVTGADLLLSGGGGASGASQPRRIAGTLAVSALPARIPTSGPIEIKKTRYEVASLAGSIYPRGAMRIALLVSSAGVHCVGSAEQTRTETLGRVGERIYQEEANSPYVLAVLRKIEASASFQRAVADRDLPAIRAAIVGFFAAHIHVVRVRAYAVEPSGAQRFLYDLGGPYVLAPVHGVVRSAGKLVGRFSFAIQDDAGYVKLAHRFTGAEVLMRRGGAQVMGTLDPGPAHVPDRGALEYAGKRYEAYSFTGEAFPSGPLRISLLVPSRKPVGG